MTLRPDQIEVKTKTSAAFIAGAESVVVACPTGWGKTYFASNLLLGAHAKGSRSVFLTDREEIAIDTTQRLRAAGLRTGLIMAGEPEDRDAKTQVVSIPTAVSRNEMPPADFAIVDECHHSASRTWRWALDMIKAQTPTSRRLGLTATPQRGDGRPLDMYEHLVMGPSVAWCVANGLLVPAEIVEPGRVEERGLACSPVEAYERFTPHTRAIVFCANVAHVTATVAEFAARNWRAEGITQNTTAAIRRGARQRLASGQLQILVGCGVFLEGFDAPSLETVILARAFGVTGTFLQAIGRGLRTSPATGKTKCTVIDLRGSWLLHGLPDEERQWSLSGKAVRRVEAITALRRCAECGAIFRPVKHCPRCGSSAATATKIPRVLNRAEKLQRLEQLPQEVRDARYLKSLEYVARVRMRMPEWKIPHWTHVRFEKQFGRKPMVGERAA